MSHIKKRVQNFWNFLIFLTLIIGCKKNNPENIVVPEQFVNYSVNGVAYSFNSPLDSFFYNNNLDSTINIQGYNPNLLNTVVGFNFNYRGISNSSTQQLLTFTPNQIIQTTTITNLTLVKITEYGNVGQFIAGNFSGALISTSNPSTTYLITCNFRVKRSN